MVLVLSDKNKYFTIFCFFSGSMFYSPCPPKLASYFSFSSLNNTLQWAVTHTFLRFFTSDHSLIQLERELPQRCTRLSQKLGAEFFSRTWYTMSWTLKWASPGKVWVPKGCSWLWGYATWPLVGVYRKKILHSLRNILDYHCRALVKGEGGGALCSIVYVVRELDGERSCGLNA